MTLRCFRLRHTYFEVTGLRQGDRVGKKLVVNAFNSAVLVESSYLNILLCEADRNLANLLPRHC